MFTWSGLLDLAGGPYMVDGGPMGSRDGHTVSVQTLMR